MNDPLAALRPLHEPPPVSWWPPAPGWWILAGLLLLAAALFWLWRRRTALRRAALRELNRLQRQQSDPAVIAAVINRLLKRYALLCYPAEQVADLTGKQWLDFLKAKGGGKFFSGKAEQALLTLPYGGTPGQAPDPQELFTLARYWIKANRPYKQGRRRTA